MDKRFLILGGTSVVSLAIGAVGGYYYAKKKFEANSEAIFETRLEQELAETKSFYSSLHKKDYATPEDAVRDLIPEGLTGNKFNNTSVSNDTLDKVVDGLKYRVSDSFRHGPSERHLALIREEPPTPVETNIFEELRTEQDLPEDFASERDPDNPYIITVDEFMHAEIGYPNLSLTFFEGDRILVDDADTYIGSGNEVDGDVDTLLGLQNLRFGHMSKDANIVYIRNEKTGYDYEVIRHQGSYGEVVAGIKDEPPTTGGVRHYS